MRRNDTATIWAPLAEIRISERSARSLSAATVEQYCAWLEQGREAPPIRVARFGDAFVVRDGRHRVAAALAAGHGFIEAEVRPIGRLLRRLRSLATLRVVARSATRSHGDEVLPGRTPRLHRGGAGSNPAVSTRSASVVSTASTRPLYGRGVGSTPAGGSASQRTLVAQRTRAPPCEGGGRWFESSRAYSRGRG